MPEGNDNFAALLEEADPIIKGIIRKRLRVTLSLSDGRQENEDALDVYGNVRLLLVAALEKSQTEDGVRDFLRYASTVANHQCSDYLRHKYPRRASLKNRVRYFLSNRPGYAVWEHGDDDLLCGFAGWRHQPWTAYRTEKYQRFCDDPRVASGAAPPVKDIERMKPDDWSGLIDAILTWVEGPVELDDLVNAVATLLGVGEAEVDEGDQDEEAPPFDPPASAPNPETEAEWRQYLRLRWAEICQLRPLQRLAYLLNIRDWDICLLPYTGIATIRQIGRALEITDEQFERLWGELPLDAAQRQEARSLQTYDERFAMLFAHLPVEDLILARVIGVERQKIINLRKSANERLRKRMGELGY
jgi:hypothetical protein